MGSSVFRPASPVAQRLSPGPHPLGPFALSPLASVALPTIRDLGVGFGSWRTWQVDISWWKPTLVARAKSVPLGLGLGVSEGVNLPRRVGVSFRRSGKVTWASPDGGENREGQSLSHGAPVVRAARECAETPSPCPPGAGVSKGDVDQGVGVA